MVSFEETIESERASAAPERSLLRCSADGRLEMEMDGALVRVQLRQCFPWSAPHHHLSLQNEDGEELALVENPADLDSSSRGAIERALAAAGFVMEVVRVLDIQEEIEIRHWTVEATQGTRTFQTHLDDWPRELPNGGMLIRDVAGDLYHLAKPASMDKRSRELLWSFVD